MKTRYKLSAFLLVILPVLGVCAILLSSSGQTRQLVSIRLSGGSLANFHKVDDGVYRSDQPSGKDFKALEKYGIREILNMRRFHSDTKKAEGTSLFLHHIRTHAHSISKDELIEAMRIIKNRKGPILIHCYHGSDRTGAVVALYRMVFQNIPVEKAIEEMNNGGYGHHKIFINIPSTLQKIDIHKVRQDLGIEIAQQEIQKAS